MSTPFRLVLSLLVLTFVASADSIIIAPSGEPLVWLVTGTFDDGGTVFGTFVYDPGTNKYSEINITTQHNIPGFFLAWASTYTAVASGFSNTASSVRFVSSKAVCIPTGGCAPPSAPPPTQELTLVFSDASGELTLADYQGSFFGSTAFVSDDPESNDPLDVTEDSHEGTCSNPDCSGLPIGVFNPHSAAWILFSGSVGSSEPLFQYMSFGG